ncbi:UNVERIFIED_CONTAM: hypothetical protein PYX00_011689 [Menopon gallinae]|uniref:Uncharacterized protein n=1 Tax=Menopon gallinae TaxID=328185 RepID=A0AAW2H8F6_9NEOP
MVICEYADGTGRMYVYYADDAKDAKEYLCPDSVVKEVVGGSSVYTGAPLHVPERCRRERADLNTHVLSMKCIHGASFRIGASKSLPPEGWEELLDCWTCCQSENNVLLGKKMVLKDGCAFTSDFYFYTLGSAVPGCCKNALGYGTEPCKIFYDAIVWDVPDTELVFDYLSSFFERKNVFLLEHGGTRYEVKFFFRTTLCTKENGRLLARDALKVGIKETARAFHDRCHVNRYFMDRIHDTLVRNSIDIEICGYRVSFVGKTDAGRRTVEAPQGGAPLCCLSHHNIFFLALFTHPDTKRTSSLHMWPPRLVHLPMESLTLSKEHLDTLKRMMLLDGEFSTTDTPLTFARPDSPVVIRDMNENIFLESEISENMTILDLKKQLVTLYRKENTLRLVRPGASADLGRGALGFRVFYNKKAITEDLPVSAFVSKSQICLHFEMREFLDAQKVADAGVREDVCTIRTLSSDHWSTGAEIDDPEIKIKVAVDRKSILERNGKAYLVIHRSRRPRIFRDLRRVLSVFQKELFLKLSVILCLIALNNIEVAVILTAILTLRSLNSTRIKVDRKFEGIVKPVCKMVFLFFYTMFVMSEDYNNLRIV